MALTEAPVLARQTRALQAGADDDHVMNYASHSTAGNTAISVRVCGVRPTSARAPSSVKYCAQTAAAAAAANTCKFQRNRRARDVHESDNCTTTDNYYASCYYLLIVDFTSTPSLNQSQLISYASAVCRERIIGITNRLRRLFTFTYACWRNV